MRRAQAWSTALILAFILASGPAAAQNQAVPPELLAYPNLVVINGPSQVDNPRINVEPRKMSGIGVEGVYASLLEYSQPKFIWINDWWPGT